MKHGEYPSQQYMRVLGVQPINACGDMPIFESDPEIFTTLPNFEIEANFQKIKSKPKIPMIPKTHDLY